MSSGQTPFPILQLDPAGIRKHAAGLGAILSDCVKGGASINFMDGFEEAEATRFYLSVADKADCDGRLVLAAMDGDRPVGTVQAVPAGIDNQPHRADIAKMLVHRSVRGQGVGAALMQAVEAGAAAAGWTVLVLDTASGAAERLYTRMGWVRVGTVPDFALMPDGSFCDTIYFYKVLPGHAGPARLSK